MKMIVYSCGDTEEPLFRRFAAEYHAELTLLHEKPVLENAALAEGMDAVNILSATYITPEILDVYQRCGVRILVSRTIGVEHVDVDYARSIGIAVANVTYSPSSVADYAIMMMLMVLRRIKPMMLRYAGQDYTARALMGRELPNLTVGIIGMGRIGRTVARHLQGFGCRILAWNRTEFHDPALPVQMVDLETLYRESDLVTLHIAATPETLHFVNAETFAKMKEGAILINTARGPLVDSTALIAALESGRLSGAGLDVFDGDRLIYYRDFKNQLLVQHEMAILNAMPNVLMLPHMAYCTDQAAEDMVRNSLDGTARYLSGEEDPWLIGGDTCPEKK